MEGIIGEIRMFSGNFAPTYWAFCNGALLPVAQYTALFSVLNTTYGGNGVNTFALPNLIERVPIHPKSGNYNLGDEGGYASNNLTEANMPPHTHPLTAKLKVNTAAGTTNIPAGSYPANTGAVDGEYNVASDGNYMATDALGVTVTPLTSGNIGFTNMQQFQVVNFIICLYGIFPVRP